MSPIRPFLEVLAGVFPESENREISAGEHGFPATGITASPLFRTATICDSVNLDFVMTSPVPCGRVQHYTVNRMRELTMPVW